MDRGVVFQDFAQLFPWRTALGNVAFGLEMKGLPKAERETIALEQLRLVKLENFARSYPHHLSGGMQQRVAIARALAYNPAVLLMDEPFAALDALTRDDMQRLLADVWRTTRKTVIYVTHNVAEAVYLADRVVVMTPHPGTVKTEVPIRLPRPRDPLSVEFLDYQKELLRLLGQEPDGAHDGMTPGDDMVRQCCDRGAARSWHRWRCALARDRARCRRTPRTTYPSRPIRLVVGFGAGGPTDIPARFIADKLGDALGQPVVVENKPAAGGIVATRDVLAQPRDGYTLLLCTHFDATNIAVYRNAGYQAQRSRADFADRQILLRAGAGERDSGGRFQIVRRLRQGASRRRHLRDGRRRLGAGDHGAATARSSPASR